MTASAKWIIAAAIRLVGMVATPAKNVKPPPEIAFALPDITETIPEPVSKTNVPTLRAAKLEVISTNFARAEAVCAKLTFTWITPACV